MTMGYMVMGIGVLLIGAAVLLTILSAVLGPGEKRKIEEKMKEKY